MLLCVQGTHEHSLYRARRRRQVHHWRTNPVSHGMHHCCGTKGHTLNQHIVWHLLQVGLSGCRRPLLGLFNDAEAYKHANIVTFTSGNS